MGQAESRRRYGYALWYRDLGLVDYYMSTTLTVITVMGVYAMGGKMFVRTCQR